MHRALHIILTILILLLAALLLGASASPAPPAPWTKVPLPYDEKTPLTALRADPGGYLWVLPPQGLDVAVADYHDNVITLGAKDLPGEGAFVDAAFEEVAGAWLLGRGSLVRISKEGQRKVIPLAGGAEPFAGYLAAGAGTGVFVAVKDAGVTWHPPGAEAVSFPKGEALPSAAFTARPAVGGGRLYLATADEGLLALDTEKKGVEKIAFTEGGAWPHIADLITDWTENLWIATKKGLFRAKENKVLRVQYPGGTSAVKSLALRGSQEVWVLLEGGRILIYNPYFGWQSREAAYPGTLPAPALALEGNARGDMWLATAQGLWRLPGRGEVSTGDGVSKIWALKVVCESPGNSSYRLGLPGEAGVRSLWYWGAFIVEGGRSTPGPGTFSFEEKGGNRFISIAGDFKTVEYFSAASAQAFAPPYPRTCAEGHPFPAAYPDEVKEYLLPGKFLPSDDPRVKSAAEEMVKPESKPDMALTVKDIVYSPLFREMAVDFLDPFAPTTFAAAGSWPFSREPLDVLRDGRGDTGGKSRLLCCLCRSRGVPARVVRRCDGLYSWCEVWISGAGWVSADVTAPLFALSSKKRPQLPKEPDAGDCFTGSVSGRDDEGGVLTVTSGGKYVVSSGDLGGLRDPEVISRSRLIVMRPGEGRSPAWDARLTVSKSLRAYAIRERWGAATLVLGNADKSVQRFFPLLNPGRTLTCAVPGHLFLKGTYRNAGNIVVFEVDTWEIWD